MEDATPLEHRVLEAAARGEEADLRPKAEKKADASSGAVWSDERTIRAEWLYALCTEAAGKVQPRGLRLRGATVSGNLNLEGVDIPFPLALRDCYFEHPISLRLARALALSFAGSYAPCINADQLAVRGDLELDQGFVAAGAVRFVGAEIGGVLNCSGGSFKNAGGHALSAVRAKIASDVFLGHGFAAEGEVDFFGAQIGGALRCEGGSFTNPGGHAVSAEGVRVDGNTSLGQGFAAEGKVDFVGAEIGGVLNCSGGSFKNAGGHALSVVRAKIASDVFLEQGFAAEGEVDFSGAQIGGALRCEGASFTNPGGRALSVVTAKIASDVFLELGFAADGEVRFLGTQIGGQFSCKGGSFTNPGGEAFGGQGMNVADRLVWLPTNRPEGVINFRNARARQIVDAQSTWPASQAIVLDGFAYDAIFCRPEDVSTAERIGWLQTNHRYSPQPYEQLASAYRKQGNAGAARQVAIAKQVARRKEGGLRWWEKAWSKLLGATVGYGYRPWLAALWVTGLWLLGLALFERGPAHAQVMMGLSGGPRPRFVAWIYVLDSLLPIVNLRQREYWVPNVASPWGWLYLDFVLFAAVAGWALATAVVAALTGLIHKD